MEGGGTREGSGDWIDRKAAIEIAQARGGEVVWGMGEVGG